MPESSSEREIFGAQWAGRICAALLLGLGIVTAVAFYDEHRLSSLETTAESTAVGDKALFPLPAMGLPEQATAPIVNFNGKALTPVSSKSYEERDSKMIRIGLDDSQHYSIYSTTEPVKPMKGEGKNDGKTFFFIKTGPGKYLKLKD